MLVRPTQQVPVEAYRWEKWEALLSYATACLSSGAALRIGCSRVGKIWAESYMWGLTPTATPVEY